MTDAPMRFLRRPQAARPAKAPLRLPIVTIVVLALLAIGFVAYVLWPRWPTAPASLDAPALPITVGGVIFNVPPAAIRRPVQRRPGTQDRLDLVFLWPSLRPPDPAAQLEPVASPDAIDRIFLTITLADSAMPPLERVKTIYPRYLENSVSTATGGLAVRPFRDGTPYQGEELFYDPANPEHFVVRCTRNGNKAMMGMCLYDYRAGNADITARFPRDWLDDWSPVARGLESLIAGLTSKSKR